MIGFVDIDNMKGINDRLGHRAGDEALRTVARALSQGVRPSDDVGKHTAGDEFYVILRLAGEEIAQPAEIANILAERCRERARSESEGVVDFTFGFASLDEFGSIDDAINAADKDMYKQKRLKNLA